MSYDSFSNRKAEDDAEDDNKKENISKLFKEGEKQARKDGEER